GALPGVSFYSLQLGEAASELADWPGPAPLTDLALRLTDFAETAACLQYIDLLISVDTAAAHLAGALGRPACVLVPAVAHWVWGLEGASTPWYPSLRLFRANKPGWEDALMNLSSALSERMST
ncbi:MAG: glycosyltransferase family 9 protein, partial [Gallionella sp.]|nr:glycosyltransferase family 9 protein [Gallionella sp.]